MAKILAKVFMVDISVTKVSMEETIIDFLCSLHRLFFNTTFAMI